MANKEMKAHERSMHPKGKKVYSHPVRISKQARKNRYRKSKGRR